MRTRLNKSQRRADILDKAARLFAQQGVTRTEMEDIRRACDISRGGLYHHFASKTAILDALVLNEVAGLADLVAASDRLPVLVLLENASRHLGTDGSVMLWLQTRDERLAYLSALEQAFDAKLYDVLVIGLQPHLRDDADPAHVAALFLTINSYINRRAVLGDWPQARAAGFAATALRALAPFLREPSALDPMIATLQTKADDAG